LHALAHRVADRPSVATRCDRGGLDPHINTLTPEQYHSLNIWFLVTAESRRMGGIQARMDFNMCLATYVRHDSAEMVLLSDLFVVEQRHIVPGKAIPALSCFSDLTKVNREGVPEWATMVRHRDAMCCGVGSVALFLFLRWQVEGHSRPDFSSRRAWYFDYLSPGRGADAKTRMAKGTFAEILKSGLLFLHIVATHYGHFMRVFSVYLACCHFVARANVGIMGRWTRDKQGMHYESAVKPADALVGAAGFSAGTPTLIAAYRTPRAEVLPEAALVDCVFPWLAATAAEVKARNARLLTASAAERAAGIDTAAEKVLTQVLPWLATVLLQDLACLQDQVRPRCSGVASLALRHAAC
jgi:hypothetical protein